MVLGDILGESYVHLDVYAGRASVRLIVKTLTMDSCAQSSALVEELQHLLTNARQDPGLAIHAQWRRPRVSRQVGELSIA